MRQSGIKRGVKKVENFLFSHPLSTMTTASIELKEQFRFLPPGAGLL